MSILSNKMLLKPDLINNGSKYLKGYWPFIWLLLMIFALYFRSLFFQYTFFDDHELVLNRIDFFKKISNFWQIFSQDAFNKYTGKFYYRPLLTATFFMDGWLGGGKLWLFHLSNIIYHLLACWLVFIFLKKITRTSLTSFLLTAVFAVHPVITQVVVWIPGRNESFLTIFLLLSFISFIKYLENNKIINAFTCLILFIAALLIKELTVFFPLMMILYVFIFRNEHKKKLIILTLVWFLLIILWAAVRSNVLGMALGATTFNEMIKSVWLNLPAVPGYIGKVFIPYGLSVYPNLKDMLIPVVIGSLFILLMLISFFNKQADKKLMWFGFAWFLIFLVPGFIKAVNMSEHRIYFPMIGLLLFTTALLGEVKLKWLPVFVTIWMVFIAINISYSGNFKNRLTLWQQAVKSSPSSAFNANNLGAMYYLENNFPQAEIYFRKAVNINRAEPLANGNLGLVLMNMNKLNEAEIYLLQENNVNPAYDNAYFNLGILYMKMGNTQLALEYMIKTISVNPGYVDAYRNLINYYQQTNQPQLLQSVTDLANKNGIKFN